MGTENGIRWKGQSVRLVPDRKLARSWWASVGISFVVSLMAPAALRIVGSLLEGVSQSTANDFHEVSLAVFCAVCAIHAFLACLVGIWGTRFISSIEYAVEEKGITIRQGVIWPIVKTVPYGMISTVMCVQGPVERRFGLGCVILTAPAGGMHAFTTLRGLPDFREVRDAIADRVLDTRCKMQKA